MEKKSGPCLSKLLRFYIVAIALIFAGNSTKIYAQTGLHFVNGASQHIAICENSTAINIDTLIEVNDRVVGDTDTWSVILSPRGTLLAGYTTVSTGSVLIPTGRSYTPPAGYVGSDSFTIKVADRAGDTDETTVVVTIIPLPLVSALSGAASVCAGASVTFSDTATSGTWYSTGSSLATVSASGVVRGVSAGTDTIMYVKTNACGSDTARRAIIVNPLAMPGAIAGTGSLCVGDTISFTDTAHGGVWSSVHTAIATISATGSIITRSGGVDTIKYSVTNSCGTVSATYVITVIPLAYAGVITGSDSVCAGSATVLADGVSGGTWESITTRVATVSASGVVIGIYPGVDTIKYTYTNSCGTSVASHLLVVKALPYSGGIGGVDTVCPGATVVFADTIAGSAGVWMTSDSLIATVDSAGIVTGVAAGTDTIIYNVTNTCGTSIAKHSITVFAMPDTGLITGDATVCPLGTMTLSETVMSGTWVSKDTAIATIDPIYGTVTALTPGLDTVFFDVSTAYCTANARFIFRVEPAPTTGVITGTANLCRGDSTTLLDTAHGGAWSSLYDSVATITDSGRVKGLSWGTSTISYTDTYNCGVTYGTFTINIDTFPIISRITGALDSVCPGDTIMLSDSIAAGTWSSIYNTIATVSSGAVIGVATGVDTIKYTVTNACGSIATGFAVHVKSDSECTNSVHNIIDNPDVLSIFPNPSQGSFVVSIYANSGDYEAQVTNLVGDIVKKLTLTANKETEVQLNVRTGVYILSAVVNGEKVTRKLVVD